MRAQRRSLSDGRWHFQHGPIDLVIGADGDGDAVQAAHAAAWRRFEQVLPELVAELPLLRTPLGVDGDLACSPRGVVAQRMWHACRPYRHGYITPMAAVAGAVAEEVIAFYQVAGVRRAWVNNGGDIALHLAPGEALRIGLCADPTRLDPMRLDPKRTVGIGLDGRFTIAAALPVRGVATSGWRGRSFSLGIADSVTVLAATASAADAAATVIANAVDLDDARIVRRPARELRDDSDLGDLAVTVDVPPLGAAAVALALRRGAERAAALRDAGRIVSALLVCQGRMATVGETPLPDKITDSSALSAA